MSVSPFQVVWVVVVGFTVSGCVGCGGWFGWRTVEDAGPYDNPFTDFVVSVGGGHETSPPQAVPLFFQKRAPFCPFGTFPLTGELPFRRGIKPPSLREVADCKV